MNPSSIVAVSTVFLRLSAAPPKACPKYFHEAIDSLKRCASRFCPLATDRQYGTITYANRQ
jgi:hypothetical protein